MTSEHLHEREYAYGNEKQLHLKVGDYAVISGAPHVGGTNASWDQEDAIGTASVVSRV